MIEQNVSLAGTTDISFTVPHEDLATATDISRALGPNIGAHEVLSDPDVATVSIVGAGMKTHPGVSATMFETLAAEGINIEMISTSSIRLTCVVRVDVVDKAVVALHRAFKLEGE
jgi:aspartate kinase